SAQPSTSRPIQRSRQSSGQPSSSTARPQPPAGTPLPQVTHQTRYADIRERFRTKVMTPTRIIPPDRENATKYQEDCSLSSNEMPYQEASQEFTPSYRFHNATWRTDRGEIRNLPVADPDWVMTAYRLLDHPPYNQRRHISGTDPSLESAVQRVRLG